MALIQQWVTSNNSRNSFKRALENFQTKHLDTPQFMACNVSFAQSIKDRLDANWKGFTEHHHKVVAHLESLDEDAVELDATYDTELDDISKIYETLSLIINARIKALSNNVTKQTPRPSEVILGIFTGKYHEYTAFRSAVVARVLDADYPAHTKIDLIVGALKKEARRHVGTVRGQDEAELNRIWRALEDTYYKQYILVRDHVGQILDLPKIEFASASAYRELVDVVSQHLHALKQLSVEAPPYDPFILEILYRKLDQDGRQIWENTRSQDDLPSVAEFMSFIEKRIIVLASTAQQGITGNQGKNKQNVRANELMQPKSEIHSVSRPEHRFSGQKRSSGSTFSSNSKRSRSEDLARDHGSHGSHSDGSKPPMPNKCLMDCYNKRPHYLWLCKKFRSLDLESRNKFVVEHKLCRRCITMTHHIDQCQYDRCSNCPDDVHNYILCPKFMVVARVNTSRLTSNKRQRRSCKSFDAHQ